MFYYDESDFRNLFKELFLTGKYVTRLKEICSIIETYSSYVKDNEDNKIINDVNDIYDFLYLSDYNVETKYGILVGMEGIIKSYSGGVDCVVEDMIFGVEMLALNVSDVLKPEGNYNEGEYYKDIFEYYQKNGDDDSIYSYLFHIIFDQYDKVSFEGDFSKTTDFQQLNYIQFPHITDLELASKVQGRTVEDLMCDKSLPAWYTNQMKLMYTRGFGKIKIVEIVNGEAGFTAVVLEDVEGNYLINYNGTEDPSSSNGLNDAIYDGLVYFNGISEQYGLTNLLSVVNTLNGSNLEIKNINLNVLDSQKQQAKTLTEEYYNKALANGDKVNFSGFSLGGSLSELSTLHCIELDKKRNKDVFGTMVNFNGLHANLNDEQVEIFKKYGNERIKMFNIQGDFVSGYCNYEDFKDFAYYLDCDYKKVYEQTIAGLSEKNSGLGLSGARGIFEDEEFKKNVVNLDPSLINFLVENDKYIEMLFMGACHSPENILLPTSNINNNFDENGNCISKVEPLSPNELISEAFNVDNLFDKIKLALIDFNSKPASKVIDKAIKFVDNNSDSIKTIIEKASSGNKHDLLAAVDSLAPRFTQNLIQFVSDLNVIVENSDVDIKYLKDILKPVIQDDALINLLLPPPKLGYYRSNNEYVPADFHLAEILVEYFSTKNSIIGCWPVRDLIEAHIYNCMTDSPNKDLTRGALSTGLNLAETLGFI